MPTDRRELFAALHQRLNERFPRLAHLPFEDRDGIVREVEAVVCADKDAEIARLRVERPQLLALLEAVERWHDVDEEDDIEGIGAAFAIVSRMDDARKAIDSAKEAK